MDCEDEPRKKKRGDLFSGSESSKQTIRTHHSNSTSSGSAENNLEEEVGEAVTIDETSLDKKEKNEDAERREAGGAAVCSSS